MTNQHPWQPGREGRPDPSDLAVSISDVLVVGTGVAGLATALYLDGRKTTIISKSAYAVGGSSERAQGGVAAALAIDDSPALHAEDTIRTGCGLTDPLVAELVTRDGPKRLLELLRLGAQIDRDRSGKLALGREAAHSRSRVVHAAGDATGAELVRVLATAVAAADGIHISEHTMALELLVDRGRVVGVLAVDRCGVPTVHVAPAVVLACGGIGRLYSRTTNPVECTGDGIAMAARAGARLSGLEFVQFHPTALDDGSDPMSLLTEALRGEGAVLVNERGHRFMLEVHPAAELAPRDVVARAIWRQRQDGHETFLDATSLRDRLHTRFPTVTALCRQRGLDPRCQPVPVSPAAHYHMGGVVVDSSGRTSLPGLYACGETASSGLHGANRLASNSLLEALVFGARVGQALSSALLVSPNPQHCVDLVTHRSLLPAAEPWLPQQAPAEHAAERARRTMWQCVGLERTPTGLRQARQELAQLLDSAPPGSGELRNILLVALLVTRAATARTESRGAHYRRDLPMTSPHWRQDLVFEGEHLLDPVPLRVASAG